MGLNSNVSETLAIFERALEQHNTILGTKYLNNKAIFYFPLRHPENKILTEPQPKKAKLLCRIRKSKLFFLMLDRDSINILKRIFSSLRDTWAQLFERRLALTWG